MTVQHRWFAWATYLTLGLVLVGSVFFLPGVLPFVVYWTIIAATLTAIWSGAAGWGITRRSDVLLLMTGVGFIAFADFQVSSWTSATRSGSRGELAAAIYGLGCLVLLAVFARGIRRERGERGLTLLLDAAIFGMSIGALFHVCVDVLAGRTGASTQSGLFVAVYQIAVFCAVGMLTPWIISARTHWLTRVIAFVCIVISASGNLLFSWQWAHQAEPGGLQSSFGVMTMLGYLLIGALAMYPARNSSFFDANLVTTEHQVDQPWWLGAALLVGPALLLISEVFSFTSPDRTLLALIALVSLVLIVFRVRIMTAELNRALTASRAGEQWLNDILSAANVATWDWQANSNRITRSPLMGPMLGISPAEVTDDPNFVLSRLVPGQQARRVDLNLDAIDRIIGKDYQVQWPNGETRWLRDAGTTVRNEAGEIQRIYGVTIDVTEFHNAFEQIRETEERFRQLVENIPPVVYRQSAGTRRITYYSPRVKDLIGFTPEEALVLQGNLVEWIHPDDRQMFDRWPDWQSEQSGVVDWEYRVRTRDGRWLWLHDSSREIRDEHGQTLYWQGTLTDITSQKEIERALVESESRFRLALDQSVVGLALWMLADSRVWVNRAFTRVAGVSTEALIETPLADFLTPDCREDYLVALARIKAEELENIELDSRLRRSDGAIREITLNLTTFRDDDGVFLGILMQVHDVTEQRAASRALKQEHDLLETLVQLLPDQIFVKDRELRFLRVNAATVRAVGAASVDEVIGKTDHDLFPRESADKFASDDRLVLTGQVLNQEEAQPGDGEPVWVSSIKVPLRDEQGNVVGLLGANREITAQRRVEEALRAAEQQFRLLVEHGPAIVSIIEEPPSNRVRYVSGQVERLLGFAPDDILASPNGWGRFIHPDDYHRVAIEAPAIMQGQRPGSLQFRMVNRQGHEVWVQVDLAAIPQPADQPPIWQALMMDVSDRKRAEAELMAAMRAAEEANRHKTEFLSTMSHELRTPMNGIIGYAHLLLDGYDGPLSRQQREDVQQITDSADRLLSLINDILDVSRIESGRMDLSLSRVSLDDVLSAARAQLGPLAKNKGLNLSVSIAPDAPDLLGDFVRIQQMVLNLLSNAVKFTIEGSVMVSARAGEPGWVDIVFEDTGIGIAPDDLPRIFDEFAQADSGTTRRFGGSGLGLTIVRRLAAMHGGRVEVQSELGRGSVFRLILPAYEIPARDLPAPVSSGETAS